MRKKLLRFAENAMRSNIIEPGKPLFDEIKGQWKERYFKNPNPITVELGCGNGEYTVGLAERNIDRNYIGIDVKGDRIYNGSTYAIENKLKNVGFLRVNILELSDFFGPGELDEIWLTFPDPRPKDREEKRRLTYPRFLNIYKNLLRQDGYFRFKTDNTALFEYTLQIVGEEYPVNNLEYTFDLYNSNLQHDHFGIKTKYEAIWTAKGEQIKYLKFQFKYD